MLVGYARVSRSVQDAALQQDAMRRAKVRRLFEEKRSGVKARPMLEAAIASLRAGDVFVIWKVDRVARSLLDLLGLVHRVMGAGASFRSLTEAFDTSTPSGRLMLQMLGAFAEFEREMIRERSMAGQEAARARGARIGRPRALSPRQEVAAYRRVKRGESMAAVARSYSVHLSSIKRVVLRVERPESSAVARRF